MYASARPWNGRRADRVLRALHVELGELSERELALAAKHLEIALGHRRAVSDASARASICRARSTALRAWSRSNEPRRGAARCSPPSRGAPASRMNVFSASASAACACSSSARCALTSRLEVLFTIVARSSCVRISASYIRDLASSWSRSATRRRDHRAPQRSHPRRSSRPSPTRTSSTRPDTSLRRIRSSPRRSPCSRRAAIAPHTNRRPRRRSRARRRRRSIWRS